jgi:MscS family membrane protein
MANLTDTIQQTLGTNAATAEILASLFLFVGVAVIGWAIYFVFNRYFSKWAQKTETTLDDDILDAVKSFIVISIAIIGIEFALSPLSFLQPHAETMQKVILAVEILLFAFATTRISNILADWYAQRAAGKGKNKNHLVFILKKIIQVVVFIFAILIILWIEQVDLTGAVVGLGVGGIAIAFALQNTLSDFFSAFSI